MFFEFFLWWYGQGWAQAAKNSLNWIKNLQRMFSIPVLIGTLFAPWKRIISPPGRSMDEKFRGMIDNLISRVVGFFVRIGVLLVSLFLLIFSLFAGLVFIISWPILPFLAIYLLYKGLTG